jgi:hypothetical protein
MTRIVPAMLDNVFRMCVDPLFPAPDFSIAKKNHMGEILPTNKMELIFDERVNGDLLRQLFKNAPELDLQIQDDEGEADSNGASDSCDEEEIPRVDEASCGGSARST